MSAGTPQEERLTWALSKAWQGLNYDRRTGMTLPTDKVFAFKGSSDPPLLRPSRVASKVLTASRVARRFIARGLPMGQTYQNPKVRLHRFRDHFRVWDLTNAGKRGKKVGDLYIFPKFRSSDERDSWLEEQSFQLLKLTRSGNPYKAIKEYVDGLAKKVDGLEVKETLARGVDVEPYGQVYDFKATQEDGKSEIWVTSSPTDFRVTSHTWMTRPNDPTKGFYHDTSYYPNKKTDAASFYAWINEGSNAGKAMKFKSMDDFRALWKQLGVNYDSN